MSKMSHSDTRNISLFSPQTDVPTGDTMMFHAEFEHAGQRAGFQVWRVENMELVPVPESLYGGFYSGDAYLVLNSTENRRGSLQYDLHYWQGTALHLQYNLCVYIWFPDTQVKNTS